MTAARSLEALCRSRSATVLNCRRIVTPLSTPFSLVSYSCRPVVCSSLLRVWNSSKLQCAGRAFWIWK
ncbi:hypothetical protein MPTK1_4g09040 [Marchantia polymorpha subsp. ruderalis]|uniref:Uncharacterized protein n=1 Tax=Marchantia polymorpha subsp. ruderalis TaxID=1480154 RepID=A0AAF6B7Y5_MARPO|nr:hypothetical protein Mp_4g09040 [Marchantia polymorpha subsp. ruderalis]